MAGGMQGGYPLPAPMRKQGNNGVLLWSLVGCGIIALLVVIIGGVSVTRFFTNNKTKGMIGVMSSLTPTAESVEKVETGLEAYQKDHNGQYPPTLEALVPKYVADKAELVCGDSATPQTMEYAVPKSDAADGFVVIRVHIGDLSVVNTQVQKMYVCLLKNGQIVSEQDVRTVLSKPGKRLTDRRSY